LTDPALAARHFSAEERLVFRRHVAWTRLVADRRTTLPDGSEGDLLEMARRERERLVLKPNRGFGGAGIVVGAAVAPSDWDDALAHALTDPEDRWVVQQKVELPVVVMPQLDDGAVTEVPVKVVLGFVPSKYGLGVLARASSQPVINVALGGGMCAVLVSPSTGGEEPAPGSED
jgi:uncharacterized circularly permuted ATP-grasp superfamily protein